VACDGWRVGCSDGAVEGTVHGNALGDSELCGDGAMLGCADERGAGTALGCSVPIRLGAADRLPEAWADGACVTAGIVGAWLTPTELGADEATGTELAETLGCTLGPELGSMLGSTLGSVLGSTDGTGELDNGRRVGQVSGAGPALDETVPPLDAELVEVLLGATDG